MCQVHPLFRLAPANDAYVGQPLRPFVVRVQTGAKSEELNVLATSSCDAIVRAMDLLFEDDAVMPPTGLFISAHPIATLPMVA